MFVLVAFLLLHMLLFVNFAISVFLTFDKTTFCNREPVDPWPTAILIPWVTGQHCQGTLHFVFQRQAAVTSAKG